MLKRVTVDTLVGKNKSLNIEYDCDRLMKVFNNDEVAKIIRQKK